MGTIDAILNPATYKIEVVTEFGEVAYVYKGVPLRLIEPLTEAHGLQGHQLVIEREAEAKQ